MRERKSLDIPKCNITPASKPTFCESERIIMIESKREGAVGVTYLVVGLGNPGTQYTYTRHNAGFLCMDYIAYECGVSLKKIKFKSLVADALIDGVHVLLMKPQTFMNASGEAVREAAAFYKIPPERVIVLCDDINLPVGKMRVRKKGSDGGQKGLRSIILQMNADTMPRIRMGVGAKPEGWDLADWVLSAFSKQEGDAVASCFPYAWDGLRRLLAGDADGAMQICNSKQNGQE